MIRLTNVGGSPPQMYTSSVGYNTHFVVLEGRKTATGIDSDADAWDFTLYINNLHVMDKRLDTATQVQPKISHEIVRGTEESVLVYRLNDSGNPQNDAAARQQHNQSTIETIRRIAELPKAEAMREMDALEVPFPQTAYMADFELTGYGAQTSSCQDGVYEIYGIQTSNPPEPAQYGGAIVYHVVLTVDDLGYATANVTFFDIYGMTHPWVLEGFLGTAQPQKPPKPPKPPKPNDDWEFIPPEDYDDTFVPPDDYLPPKTDPDWEFVPPEDYLPPKTDPDWEFVPPDDYLPPKNPLDELAPLEP